jgi:Zn-dependent protease
MLTNLTLAGLITNLIILVIALPVHEMAHAWMADYFGDQTPRMNGRLTINPLAHLDWIGSLLLVVAGFGWAKPVPINPYVLGRRSPAAVMWVSLAGPAANFLMAILAAIPFRLGLVHLDFATSAILPTLSSFLFAFITINLTLFLFNLIPIAPLDGEKILGYFFPPSWNRALSSIGPYGPMILMAVIFVGPLLGFNLLGIIMNPPLTFLLKVLIGVSL